MRRVVALAIFVAMASSIGVRATPGPIVETPVAFSVVNTNTSAAPCASDRNGYVVRGSMTAPSELIESPSLPAVTLYLHGSGDASTWHFIDVPGYDYLGEMANLGHVSVFVHQLGYERAIAWTAIRSASDPWLTWPTK